MTGGRWHGHAAVSTGRKGLGARKKTIVGSRISSDSIHPMLATLGAITGVDRFRGGDDWAVFAVQDGRARTTPVRIGHRNNRAAEVLSGLSPGTAVILHPSDRIGDGTRVSQRTEAKASVAPIQ